MHTVAGQDDERPWLGHREFCCKKQTLAPGTYNHQALLYAIVVLGKVMFQPVQMLLAQTDFKSP
jgi:hypothetical protein